MWNKFSKVFLHKLHLKCIKNSNIAVINDLHLISERLRTRGLRFAGHCAKSESEVVSQVLLWQPTHGRRSRGPPKKDYIKPSFRKIPRSKTITSLIIINTIIHRLRSRQPLSFSMHGDHQQVWQSAVLPSNLCTWVRYEVCGRPGLLLPMVGIF